MGTQSCDFPFGIGGMARRIRAHHWAATSLGPVDRWPLALRNAVSMILDHPLPMAVAWGPDLVTIYNDAYVALLAEKSDALGRRFLAVWAEAHEIIAPPINRALAGEPSRYENAPLTLLRAGQSEEAFFDHSFSPLRDETGAVAGVLNTAIDTTARLQAERDREHAEGTSRQSEAMTRSLVEQLPGAAVFIVGPDLRYRFAGGEALEHAGFTAQNFVGRDLEEVLPPESVSEYTQNYVRALEGVPFVLEHQAHDRVFLTRGTPLRNTAGEIVAALAVSYDITERRRAEESLRESEMRFRALVTTGAVSIYRMSPDWRLMYQLNSQTLANTADPIDNWPDKYILEEDRERVFAAIQEAIRTKSVFDLEHRVRLADGSIGWVLSRAVPMLGPDGQVTEWFGTGRDVTERREAQDRLRKSEERQAFLLTLGDAMRTQSSVNAVIEAAARVLGKHLNASRVMFAEFDDAKGIADIFHGWFADGAEPFPAVMNLEDYEGPILKDLRAGRTVRIEDAADASLDRPDLAAIAELGVKALLSVPLIVGGQLVVNLSVHQHAPRRWKDDEVALVQEVAERLWADLVRARTEAALRESEQKYRSLFETMGQGYCELELIRDSAGRAVDQLYLELNPAFQRLFGVPAVDAKGRKASEVFPRLERSWTDAFDRVVQTRTPERIEQPVGSLGRWFEVFAYPGAGDRIVVLYEDVTERKQAELSMRESQERQAFLLRLSDALRAEPDADAVANRAIRMLHERMQLDRCYIAFYRVEDDRAGFPYQVGNDKVPALPDMVRLSDFPDAFEQVLDRTFVIEDDFERRGLSEAEKRNSERLGMRALLASTLRTGEGNPLCSMAAVSASPRRWTRGEIALVEEVAERTWSAMERARAETGLRASEEKFRKLFDSIDEGLAIVEMIYDTAGEIRDMIFRQVNRSYERQGGVYNVVGRSIFEVLPNVEDYWLNIYRQVVKTGEPERVESHQQDVDRWFDVYFSRLDDTGRFVAIVFNDISDRKRAEATLRESEERQAFLLRLSDALRPLADPSEIKAVAAQLLGEQLGANRVFYADADHEHWLVAKGYEDRIDPLPDLPFPMATYGQWIIDELRAGRRLMVRDLDTDARFTQAERRAQQVLQIKSALAVPLVKKGRLVAMLALHDRAPRDWTQQEVALVDETAQRTWAAVERARAEEALRESEHRFRTLFSTLDEAVMIVERLPLRPDGLRDWRYLGMNRAAQTMFNIGDLTGQSVRDNFPQEDEGWYDIYDRALETGEVARFEREALSQGKVLQMFVTRVSSPRAQIMVVMQDVTARRRAQDSLRESEERQAFLLELSDAYREHPEEAAIGRTCVEALARHMGVDRCYMTRMSTRLQQGVVGPEYCGPGLPSVPGAYPYADFPEVMGRVLEGESLVVIDDVVNDPTLTDLDKTSIVNALTFGALIIVNLYRGEGNSIWALVAGTTRARKWTDSETQLVLEVAERTWAAMERSRAEAALRESEERFRLLVNNVQEYALFQADPEGRVTSWNPGAERLFGYPNAEIVGQHASALLTEEDRRAGVLANEIARVLAGHHEQDARWLVRKDGSRFWAQWITEPVRDASGQLRGVAKVLRDETDRQKAEEKVRRSLADKEELLKEVHHRVKNNLQVISSLVNLQANNIEDANALSAFEETRNRVYSIAAIHELLYRSTNFEAIEVAEYARRLVPDLIALYAADQRVRAAISGDGCLELERAVPYGLLLNELVSNVCKHAFPQNRSGDLAVSFRSTGGHILMTVSDNGVGLPPGFDYRRANSLGLKLVHNLTRQLRATIDLHSGVGTTVTVTLPKEAASEPNE